MTEQMWTLVAQGGLSIVIFVIWYFTFKWSIQQNKASRADYVMMVQQLIQVIKDNQEHSLLLTGTLDRLSQKLDNPVVCPLAVAPKDHGDQR